MQQNPGKQQSYQGISAETVGVGANNQVKKNGKPVNCDGAAGNVDIQPPGAQSLTTTRDWVKTRSLSEEERPAGSQMWNKEDVFIEITSSTNAFDVNLVKPVVSVCDVTARGQQSVLSCWGFDVTEVRKLQHEDSNLTILLEWLESNVTPSEADLFIASPAAKYFGLA
ncbi:MAG: hypothetical protein AB2658_12575 [Candidatus Thiodiazotropha endolucinida]